HRVPSVSSSTLEPSLALHFAIMSLQYFFDAAMSEVMSIRIFSLPISSMHEYRISTRSSGTGIPIRVRLLNLIMDHIYMAKGVAIGLLVASLILLIIYGADVMVASSSSNDSFAVRRGFLPFDESVRGGAFGGGAVVMSIIAFVIARKDHAPAVSALLFVNGGLIVAGM